MAPKTNTTMESFSNDEHSSFLADTKLNNEPTFRIPNNCSDIKYITRINQTHHTDSGSSSSKASSTDSGCIVVNQHHHHQKSNSPPVTTTTAVLEDDREFVIDNSKDYYYCCEAIGGISTSNSYWATKTCKPFHSVDVVAVQKTINNKQQFYLQSAQQQRVQQQLASEDQKRAAAWPFSWTSLSTSLMPPPVAESEAVSLNKSASLTSTISNDGYATPPSPPQRQNKNPQKQRQIVSITLQLQPLEIAPTMIETKKTVSFSAEMAQQQLTCRQQAQNTTAVLQHCSATKLRNKIATNQPEKICMRHQVRALVELCKNPVATKGSEKRKTTKSAAKNLPHTEAAVESTIQSVGNAMCITLARPLPLKTSSMTVSDLTMTEAAVHVDIMPLTANFEDNSYEVENINIENSKHKVILVNGATPAVATSTKTTTLSSSAVSSGSSATPPTTNAANSDEDEYEDDESEDELNYFERNHHVRYLQHRDSSYESNGVDDVNFDDDDEESLDQQKRNVGDAVTTITPKKLSKPWKDLPSAKELQNELLFNEKMGIDVLKTKRSEFKQILHKIRNTQHKRETAEQNKTDLERAFEKRRGKQPSDVLILSTTGDDLTSFSEELKPNTACGSSDDALALGGDGFSTQPEFMKEFYKRALNKSKY